MINMNFFSYAGYLIFKFSLHVSTFATLYTFSRPKRKARQLKAQLSLFFFRQKTFFIYCWSNKNQSGNCFDCIQSTKKETKGWPCFVRISFFLFVYYLFIYFLISWVMLIDLVTRNYDTNGNTHITFKCKPFLQYLR